MPSGSGGGYLTGYPPWEGGSGYPPGGVPDQVPPPGGSGYPPGVPDWVPPRGVRAPPPLGGYLTRYPRGVRVLPPPGGVWVPPPPLGGYLTRYPPGGVWVPPSPRGGGFPGRTTEGVLTTRRAVCLLRSRRRTFLFNEFSVYFADSPGVPPSATAHELFRGFSYVAPILLDDNVNTDNHNPLDHKSIAHVSIQSCLPLLTLKIGK